MFEHDSKFNVDVVPLLAAASLQPKRILPALDLTGGLASVGLPPETGGQIANVTSNLGFSDITGD
jgi:hypothetical protein